MDKRQKNNLMTTITLIVVLGQFILWIILLLLDIVQFWKIILFLGIKIINSYIKSLKQSRKTDAF